MTILLCILVVSTLLAIIYLPISLIVEEWSNMDRAQHLGLILLGVGTLFLLTHI